MVSCSGEERMTPFAIHEDGKIRLRYWTTTLHHAADASEIDAWKKHCALTWPDDPAADDKAQALESILAAEREQEEWKKQNENV